MTIIATLAWFALSAFGGKGNGNGNALGNNAV
jgi:hypothetical protein